MVQDARFVLDNLETVRFVWEFERKQYAPELAKLANQMGQRVGQVDLLAKSKI